MSTLYLDTSALVKRYNPEPGSQWVVLDPEITETFPKAKAVNDALRGLLELARASAHLPPPAQTLE